jgi:hypothetical protein
MCTRLFCLFLWSASAGTVVLAHHSYAEYDRERIVAVEGTLEQLTLGNPHGNLMVRTDQGQLLTAEWGNASMLSRTGFVAGMLAAGDRVIVTGSPTKDPEKHRMSLLKQIDRPRDGWQWSRGGVRMGTERARP